MKKFFKIFFVIILLLFPFYNISIAEPSTVLTGSVSMVPNTFYGTWRVVSKLEDTDSPQIFKKSGLDLWNLSKSYDVIKLSNPFNGAQAEIKIDRVENSVVVFTKKGKYGSKILTDTVEMKLNGNNFTGTDKIQLDTLINGKIMKTETALYSLNGEKIAGEVN